VNGLQPRLLDLFCGAGGAAYGYTRAGFLVTGIDIDPMPRFPYRFEQADAMEYLAEHGHEYDAIHASPPCHQRYSVMSRCSPGTAQKYPDLIAPLRELLVQLGIPWVIENVPGAPLDDPVTLCGTQFGLGTRFGDLGWVNLRRHRLFESSFHIPDPGPHTCNSRQRKSITVTSHGRNGNRPEFYGKGYQQACREAMGIGWMNREELGEAIPPAYTEWTGAALMLELRRSLARAA
jgi:DNA (cytosine-5)-methyltransferase 1